VLSCGPLQVIVALPGEFSTMAGRRIQRAVSEHSGRLGPQHQGRAGHPHQHLRVVRHHPRGVPGAALRGASTLYGPHTLDAYIYTAVQLAEAMLAGRPVNATVSPEDFSSKLISLVPPVVLDTVPTGWSFGSVFRQPGEDVYTPGQTVEVVFWSANPRNNLRHGGTYLEVQRLHPSVQQLADGAHGRRLVHQVHLGQAAATTAWTVSPWPRSCGIFQRTQQLARTVSSTTGMQSP